MILRQVHVTVDPNIVGSQFTVNTNKDDKVNVPHSHCTAEPSSIQEAIIDANVHPGRDIIKFNLPPDQTTIHASSSVRSIPDINDSVIIDGITQPGYNGKPIVQISGDGGKIMGLRIIAGNSVVRGLAINGFTIAQISLEGYFPISPSIPPYTRMDENHYTLNISPKGGNIIEGNYIGINADGTSAPSGDSNKGAFGINIEESSNNKIGGDNPDQRNIISGDLNSGIRVIGGTKKIDIFFDGRQSKATLCDIQCASSNNIIQGNYIGT